MKSLEVGEAGKVFLLLDDIVLQDSTLHRMLALMSGESLDMVSVSYATSYCPLMRPQRSRIGHGSTYVEMNGNLFTASAFRCWQDMLQPDVNSLGHGCDNMFGALCKVRTAVCDVCVVEHAQRGGQSYSNFMAGGQKDAYRSVLKWHGRMVERLFPLQLVEP